MLRHPAGTVQRPEPLWWLHEGNRALRDVDWKLVAAKDQPWELFHLAEAPNETRDLSGVYPGKVSELSGIWERMESGFSESAHSRW